MGDAKITHGDALQLPAEPRGACAAGLQGWGFHIGFIAFSQALFPFEFRIQNKM